MAAVVLIASLSACGSASKTTTDTSANANSNSSTTSTTAAKKDAKLSILTYSQSTAEYSEKMPVLAEIAKRTGITLEWQNLPVDAAQEKLDLTFASGNLPDILLWTVKDYIDNLGQKGALIPLESLVTSMRLISKHSLQRWTLRSKTSKTRSQPATDTYTRFLQLYLTDTMQVKYLQSDRTGAIM
jgi:maltose-binding protein MalE